MRKRPSWPPRPARESPEMTAGGGFAGPPRCEPMPDVVIDYTGTAAPKRMQSDPIDHARGRKMRRKDEEARMKLVDRVRGAVAAMPRRLVVGAVGAALLSGLIGVVGG